MTPNPTPNMPRIDSEQPCFWMVSWTNHQVKVVRKATRSELRLHKQNTWIEFDDCDHLLATSNDNYHFDLPSELVHKANPVSGYELTRLQLENENLRAKLRQYECPRRDCLQLRMISMDLK